MDTKGKKGFLLDARRSLAVVASLVLVIGALAGAMPAIGAAQHLNDSIEASTTAQTADIVPSAQTEMGNIERAIGILPASTAPALVTQINAIAGLTAVQDMGDPNLVIVTGSVAAAPYLTLDIDPGVTVRWDATYEGSRANYLLTIAGGGTFILSGTIDNEGNGGAMTITGTGTTATIDGGTVTSANSGNALTVNAADVNVKVLSGAVIESQLGNTNAALQVTNNTMGTIILVDGGTVRSIGGGYGIADGTSGTPTNNSSITVASGLVSAGTSTAIRSLGDAVVTISGGTVTNAPANNLNPVINMNNGTGTNVIVTGGDIHATTTTAYAIQTDGNINVSGGHISTISGRAINLTGLNSLATISGGIVQATGSGGIAISTGTTSLPAVANASIHITGGIVAATDGIALRITGVNSRVDIDGGFIFGHGTNAASVVPIITTMTDGLIVAWERPGVGPWVYDQDSATDLIIHTPTGGTATWNDAPFLGSTIDFAYGDTTGLFSVDALITSDVTVVRDTGSGNGNGNGNGTVPEVTPPGTGNGTDTGNANSNGGSQGAGNDGTTLPKTGDMNTAALLLAALIPISALLLVALKRTKQSSETTEQ